ncbi:hypothetical protein BDW02DRAFT_566107 [Decorospora gaudefroyi]|uniref:Rhodopsin domain-containing protein n=1 Tax=Decorospora gaudefroyi TaxID=184978 RepID=A0A6A5KMT8_9PLEO|nr:hypothetical protein BDW02DRAFT_566107 [Decorospora gaudefroyi]
MVVYSGFGFDAKTVQHRFGAETLMSFYKGVISYALVWNATLCLSKVSVLMYRSIIPNSSMVKWTRWVGGTIILWTVVNVLTTALICRRFALNWDWRLEGRCGSLPVFYFAMGLVNLVTDMVIIILPMPYLYRLRLPWRKKVLAMALLSIGIA